MSENRPPKIAVVAVHGVAYHEPGSSANCVSELLLGLPDGNEKYGPFAAETIHIPLKPLHVEPLIQPEPGGFFNRLFNRFRERTVYLTRAWRRAHGTMEHAGEKSNEIAANDYTRLLLQDYRGSTGGNKNPKDQRDCTAYRTTRLAGKRRWKDIAGPEKEIGVDVYEMYWADLSRPKQTILSFFMALYQLLFHLASLSRLAISTSYENRDDKVWRTLTGTQGWAIRFLTLPIPILSVLLMITFLGAVPGLFQSTPVPSWVAICGAAFLGLLSYYVIARKVPAIKWPWTWFWPATKRPLTWVLLPMAFVLPLAGIVALLIHFHRVHPQALLAFEALLLGSGVYFLLSTGSYDDVREGTSETALGLWVPWIIFFAVLLFGFPAIPISQVTLWAVQIVLAALHLSWILLFISAFLAFVLGGWSWRKIRRDEKKKKDGDLNRWARARAAVRTSRLALALPTMGVLIVTLALFAILFYWSTSSKQGSIPLSNELFDDSIKTPLTSPSLSWFILDQEEACRKLTSESCPCSMPPADYFKAALAWSATPAFTIILALLVCGLLLIVLWLIPSIYSESHPPWRSNNISSKHMGNWLSRGLDASKYRTMLFWLSAFAVPAVLWIVDRLLHNTWVKTKFGAIAKVELRLDRATVTLLVGVGAVAGSLAILASLAKSGSSFLGIILDVDNYLRASPKDETPRARILERYVSLLHYLQGYKDPTGAGYDRIVIVAHSLGALISADLLRFLEVQKNSPKIEIHLFTMGNPLRQLLNRYFPYLYEWVRPLPDNSIEPLKDAGQPEPQIGSDASPDPMSLGVKRWVNAYRSGDYVGRSVWLDEWYDREVPARVNPDEPGGVYIAKENPPGRREEMCIGAGAHQHYWDPSAPDIAEKLDQLIST